jgi:hypothetical protein
LLSDVELVIFDNLLTLCTNGSESASDAWVPMQNWLLKLWRRMKRSVDHMTIKAHLAELERRHKALEHEIAEALVHSSTDDLKIAELKVES